MDILTGIVLGVVLGLFFPLETYKLPLVLVAVYLGVKRIIPAR